MTDMPDIDRWAIVTGSAKRLGRAVALELATQGWDIVVHYHTSAQDAQTLAEQIQAMGRAACLVEMDLANAKVVEKMINSLAEEIGMIDALVNNASICEPDTLDPDGSRHWAINAEGPRILSKAFKEHLPKSETGAIVNMLDAFSGREHFLAYDRSKAFLSNLTENMAKSFAPSVRVNGIALGEILPRPGIAVTSPQGPSSDQIVSVERVATTVARLLAAPHTTGEIIKIL